MVCISTCMYKLYDLLNWKTLQFSNGLFFDCSNYHCEKSVCIRSFSALYFPAFWLNIPSECGKTRSRKTPNTDTFYAVYISDHFCARFVYQLQSYSSITHGHCITVHWITSTHLFSMHPLSTLRFSDVFKG